MSKNPRIAVLGSGTGSNFVALAEAVKAQRLEATIALVISDRPEALILTRAQALEIPTRVLPTSPFRTKLSPEGETALLKILQDHAIEWVILAGYLRVVKEPLLSAYAGRIINIHPSLLPAFPGLHAWEQALQAGVAEAGCTVHYVNAVVDGGEIIAQQRVPVLPDDTAATLHTRIQVAEHELFPQTLQQVFHPTEK